MTFQALMDSRPWKPIRHCPGRYVLPPCGETPAQLIGSDAAFHEYQLPSARDPVVVARIADGGLISYRRADGLYVHTLNTPEGLARKLEQLGVPERQSSDLRRKSC